ncbi:concanavalin A-like lectin/glucanase superfamily protein [Roseimicrobium gellanilyticum]|uniref:Concanavalin A-like lectin/glucanase superfamily protein n=1 Tax=Roseimicrobium gellanilyticum TaxID=748857 RepID=A0A366HVH3_9BACT|nr:DUF1553 domain-containing protein [Roseimicrobium gellanilyticum]RBP48266.1 concanavalin A-like lectin/glucanase superfamily protein [Roseimicrobium gellanilyticum]
MRITHRSLALSRVLALALALVFVGFAPAASTPATVAAKPTPAQVEFFESKIRPVLVGECYDCHGAKKDKGGLRLDSRDAMLAGGDSGPLFVPGAPEKSLLIQSLMHTTPETELHMPKDGAKLEEGRIADFKKWIADGAPDPRDKPEPVMSPEQSWEQALATRKQWWSFLPVKATEPPAVKDAAWSQHPVDRFLLAKQEAQGLQPVKAADAATLIRRVSYVLTGLPPTPEEIETFKTAFAKNADAALSELIDRLMASPRYGEAWARHWMDWVRYAESHGSEGDAAIPFAWRYRDYLIRAFNSDVPYPQMVREAIAGDMLKSPRVDAVNGINESALGIGQLRMVLHGFSPTDSLDELVTFTDNQVDTVTKAFLGLTVSCARCHNHKFDAISQADFYSLYGIFTSTRPALIDVNLPEVGKVQREELTKLKGEIKKVVAEAWLAAAKDLPTIPEKPVPPMSEGVIEHWDLRKEKWYTDGHGVQQGPTKAGEFSIATEGERIIAGVHPSGVFSDLLSTKVRGVLMSPRLKNPGGKLWMRSAGGGMARARYVVQNYPRTGTIHKAKDFKDEPGDARLAWRELDLEYWKGDDIFIQCTTVADQPAEAKLDARSWFGITDVIITKGEPPPAVSIHGNPAEAVQAWQSGKMTDAQAELLDSLIAEGKLPNDAKKIPAAAALLARYREVEAALPLPTRAPGVLEAEGHDAPMFAQGDHKRPGPPVPRRFLDGINPTPYHTAKSGRLELAESIVDPANPLTSRVVVNRLWQTVFGNGLVATPDNFGRLGEPPSHPELLDYLASRFDSEKGSIKSMLKFLLNSKAFQLDSEAAPAAAQKDPQNKLLTHFTVRRLEAESIRDSILALSGKMEEKMYGESESGGSYRRSVYVKVVRNSLDDFLTAFDAPVPSASRGKRDSTNVPAQSLALLNDRKVINWSGYWGARSYKNKDLATDEARVQRMFQEAFGRAATETEVAQNIAFLGASSKVGEQQQAELARLEKTQDELRSRIESVLSPVRNKLTEDKRKSQGAPPDLAGVPEPLAEWDFEDGPNDLKGKLPLTLEGGARIEHGMLILDGGKALARSAPIKQRMRGKTLEAWVLLDELEQRGGGVMTLQDLKGNVFDSIVFAEHEAGCWVAGSDFGRRTKPSGGDVERDAAQRAVHVAISWDANARVNVYRDGQLYGRGYKADDVAVFEPNAAEVLLGCRHGAPGGNRMLRGKILRARLYDRPLRPDDIEMTRKIEQTVVTERDVMDALTEANRANVRQWQDESEALHKKLIVLREQVAKASGPEQAWQSLALALVNLKEFIYLK